MRWAPTERNCQLPHWLAYDKLLRESEFIELLYGEIVWPLQ